MNTRFARMCPYAHHRSIARSKFLASMRQVESVPQTVAMMTVKVRGIDSTALMRAIKLRYKKHKQEMHDVWQTVHLHEKDRKFSKKQERASMRDMREQWQRCCANMHAWARHRMQPREQRMNEIREQKKRKQFEKMASNIDFQMMSWAMPPEVKEALNGVKEVTDIAKSLEPRFHELCSMAEEIKTEATRTAAMSVSGIMSVSHTMDMIRDDLKRVAQPVVEAAEAHTNAAHRASGAFDGIIEALKRALPLFWRVPLALLVFALVKASGAFGWLFSIIGDTLKWAFGSVWDRIRGCFGVSSSNNVDLQSATSDMLPFVATLASFSLVPTKNPYVMAEGMLKHVQNAGRTSDGFKHIFENGLSLLEGCVNYVLSFFTKYRVEWTSQSERLVTKFRADVDAIEAKWSKDAPNPEEIQSAMLLLQNGHALKASAYAPWVRAMLEKHWSRLNCLLSAHRGAAQSAYSFRQTPVFVTLYGGSGVGKTSLLTRFATAALVLSKEVSAKYALVNLWQKGTSGFDNGYMQQKCVVMDDLFQVKTNGASTDTEAMRIIKGVGNFAYPLNFADLESKGRYYFTSPLMVATTNVRNVADAVKDDVYFPQAVTRRMVDRGYWIEPSPEYQLDNGRMDYRKLSQRIEFLWKQLQEDTGPLTLEKVMMAYPWDAWFAYPHTGEGEYVRTPNPLSVYEIVMEVAKDLKDRKVVHQREMQLSDEWLNKLAEVDTCEPQCALLPEQDMFTHEFVKLTWEDVERNVKTQPTNLKQVMAELRGEVFESPESSVYGSDDPTEMTIEDHKRTWYEYFLSYVTPMVEFVRPMATAVSSYAVGLFDRCRKAFDDDGWTPRKLGALVLIASAATAIIAAVFALLGLLWAGITAICKAIWRKVAPESQYNVPDDFTPAKKQRPLGMAVHEQASEVDAKVAKMRTNCYVVGYAGRAVGSALFLGDSVLVMNLHYKEALMGVPSETMIQFTPHSTGAAFSVSRGTFMAYPAQEYPKHDLWFVKCTSPRAHANLTHFFLNESSLSKMFGQNNTGVTLHSAELNDGVVTKRAYTSNSLEYVREQDVRGKTYSGLVKYYSATVSGDCGAPLCLTDSSFWGCQHIIGIHGAGGTDWGRSFGMAIVLSKEFVEGVMAKFGAVKESSTILESKGVEVSTISEQSAIQLVELGVAGGSVVPLGTVSKPTRVANKSKLVRSPVFGAWGDAEKAPARLGPYEMDGVRHIPHINAVKQYQSPLYACKVKNLEAVVAVAMAPHAQATKDHSRKIMTFEESATSITGWKLRPINRSTSAGYPYALEGGVGKRLFFGDQEEFDFTSEACKKLRADVESIVEDAKNGVRQLHLFCDFLKDETRPHAKIAAGATRGISNSPLALTLATRMYFGAFISATLDRPVVTGMAPGINVYTDWGALMAHISKNGEFTQGFDGDFGAFDASEQPDVHLALLRYINEWYTIAGGSEQDNKVREVLFLELVHSRHLTPSSDGRVLDTVVQWNKSMPSGHVLTTTVNSMYSLVTLVACYQHLTGRLMDFHEQVRSVTFGDDNITGAADTILGVFNQRTVAAAMKELFGMKYTSAQKGQELLESKPLRDLEFLKRGFARAADVDSGWVAPLALSSTLYSAYYVRDKKNPLGNVQVNMENTLGELSLHPQEVWDQFTPRMFDVARKANIPLKCTSRAAWRLDTLTRVDSWF